MTGQLPKTKKKETIDRSYLKINVMDAEDKAFNRLHSPHRNTNDKKEDMGECTC